MEKKHRNILIPFYAIHPHRDWVEDYMSHMEYACKKISSHGWWKEANQESFQEKFLRHNIYLKQGGLCGGNPHIWMDACTLWPVAESWAIGCVDMDLLVWLSFHSLVGWGDTCLYFLLAFSEIILMHHFIVRSMGIYGCWRILIIVLGHGNHTYAIAITKVRASMLVCIRNIRNFMLGGEVS